LDYTPNEYNTMQPAMLYDLREQEISRYP